MKRGTGKQGLQFWLMGLTQFAASLAVALACPGQASAQPSWGGASGAAPDWGARNLPVERWNEDLNGARGILIANGQYVPGPYRIGIDGEYLTLNGAEIRSTPSAPDGGPKMRRPRSETEIRRAAARRMGDELVQHLANGLLVVALPDQPLVAMMDGKVQHDLLNTLLAEPRQAITPVSVTEYYAPAVDAAVWDAWIAAFVPSPDFRERARAKIDAYNQAAAEGEAVIAAARRLNTFSYPLSVFGMVVTTLGIGHLLSNRPPVGAKSLETDSSPLAIRVLTWSLVLVVVYSVLDLTWTILAHQAGQMLELNPLGSRLIDNPLALIAFKGAATGMAVALLFALRKYRKAQLAAWWVCLVCTLLTARWLTISPMFAA